MLRSRDPAPSPVVQPLLSVQVRHTFAGSGLADVRAPRRAGGDEPDGMQRNFLRKQATDQDA
jgi:hypothetical protein